MNGKLCRVIKRIMNVFYFLIKKLLLHVSYALASRRHSYHLKNALDIFLWSNLVIHRIIRCVDMPSEDQLKFLSIIKLDWNSF